MKKQVSDLTELLALLGAHAVMLGFLAMVLIWI